MGESASSPRRITAKEKAAKAIALRKAGASFEEIAQKLGYSSRARAYEAVTAGIRELFRDAAEELVALELERLDSLQLAHWPAAIAGDGPATDRVLKIMERRAKLMGLDAPSKIAADVTSGGKPIGPLVPSHLQQAMLADPRALELACELDALLAKPPAPGPAPAS